MRTSFSALLLTGALVVAVMPAAASAAVSAEGSVSSNWSGYVVGGSSSSSDSLTGTGVSYKSVSGSWTQPAVSASSTDTHSVFWVGLGGASSSNNALEQIGTAADYVDGKADYYAWYELVPAASVKLDLAITPGDKISAQVTVEGTKVTVSIANQTTGKWVTKTLTMSNPDTSSAEWIAESPSGCDSAGNCQTLSLADFGTVTFTNASATTSDGHTGTISDSSWTAVPVTLSSTSSSAGYGTALPVAAQLSSGAQPSSLSSDGSSFSVTAGQDTTGSQVSGDSGASTAAYPPPWSDSGGAGPGDPYGYGAYGYGYGY